MDYTEIALAVLALAGACVSGFFAFMGKKSQSKFDAQVKSDAAKQEQQVQFYATVIAECQKLRESNSELQRQITDLQSEVHRLREQLEFYEENHLATEAREMLERVFDQATMEPSWIRDVANNKWYLNDAYCRTFGIKRQSFWTPVNILGRYEIEDVLKYATNDMMVIETGTMVEFKERVRKRIMDPRCNEFILGRFSKTPFTINDRPYIVGRLIEELSEDDS